VPRSASWYVVDSPIRESQTGKRTGVIQRDSAKKGVIKKEREREMLLKEKRINVARSGETRAGE